VIEKKLNLHTTTDFVKKQPRKDKDVLLPLHDSRFEIINRSPSNLSSIPRQPNLNFKTQSARKGEMFGTTKPSIFYDANAEFSKSRMDSGFTTMNKMTSRKGSVPLNKAGGDVLSIDLEKAIAAQTNTFKPRHVVLSNFKTHRARDDSILRQDDRMHNIELDWTKEERAEEIKQRGSQYRNKPLYFNR
jgi:hypothetical protein